MSTIHTLDLVPPSTGAAAVAGAMLSVQSGIIRSMASPVDSVFLHRFGSAGAVLFTDPVRHPTIVSIKVETDSASQPALRPITTGPASPAGISPEALRAVEAASLEAAPDAAYRRAALYFYDLDFATNPGLSHAPPSSSASTTPPASMQGTASKLYNLVVARKSGFVATPTLNRGDLRPLDVLLRSILRKHFSSQRFGKDTAHAHILFGAGELLQIFHGDAGPAAANASTNASNCGPNSPLIFAYPEFALWAIRLLPDPGFWKSALPGLVAACEAYLLSYGDLGAGNKLVPRPGKFYERLPVNQLARSLRDELYSEYREMTPRRLEDRLTSLVVQGIRPPKVMPMFMAHAGFTLAHSRRYDYQPRKILTHTRIPA